METLRPLGVSRLSSGRCRTGCGPHNATARVRRQGGQVLLAVLLAVVLGGCRDGTSPAPVARLEIAGDLTWECDEMIPGVVCVGTIPIRNAGTACAVGTYGTVQLYDQAGAQLGGTLNWSLGLDEIRPGSMAYVSTGGVFLVLAQASRSFRLDADYDHRRC